MSRAGHFCIERSDVIHYACLHRAMTPDVLMRNGIKTRSSPDI